MSWIPRPLPCRFNLDPPYQIVLTRACADVMTKFPCIYNFPFFYSNGGSGVILQKEVNAWHWALHLVTLCVDCEQSLFFLRFSESKCTGAGAAKPRDAHGHLRVSRFARRTTQKKRDCQQSTLCESNCLTEFVRSFTIKNSFWIDIYPASQFLC